MVNKKTCFRCGVEKPLLEFYAHSGMADGYLNKCKECTKLDTRANRLSRIDYYREYERFRAMLPHRVEARARYAKTSAGKAAHNKANKAWCEQNTVKRAANILVRNALKRGVIIKADVCEECSSDGRIHAHHDDYSKPLDVRWLCSKCHRAWHKENGSGANG